MSHWMPAVPSASRNPTLAAMETMNSEPLTVPMIVRGRAGPMPSASRWSRGPSHRHLMRRGTRQQCRAARATTCAAVTAERHPRAACCRGGPPARGWCVGRAGSGRGSLRQGQGERPKPMAAPRRVRGWRGRPHQGKRRFHRGCPGAGAPGSRRCRGASATHRIRPRCRSRQGGRSRMPGQGSGRASATASST